MSFNLFRKEYSRFHEETILSRYIERLSLDCQYVVDIGAADGKKMSNTYRLFKSGVSGLAIEANKKKFDLLEANYKGLEHVDAVNEIVSPENIGGLMAKNQVPQDFSVLSLDIDGYDYDVLSALLQSGFKPSIIITEINESIPPPVKFKVNYHKGFSWKGGHFFGYSIAYLEELTALHSYRLMELHHNNAILIASRHYPDRGLSPSEAWLSGYWHGGRRKHSFKYNRPMEALYFMKPEEAVTEIKKKFSQYSGLYDLSL